MFLVCGFFINRSTSPWQSLTVCTKYEASPQSPRSTGMPPVRTPARTVLGTASGCELFLKELLGCPEVTAARGSHPRSPVRFHQTKDNRQNQRASQIREAKTEKMKEKSGTKEKNKSTWRKQWRRVRKRKRGRKRGTKEQGNKDERKKEEKEEREGERG